ncbi:MAG: hypothetical protein H7210_02110 [Pyrinomonadaceae bacterium]|nr:hypothetical protein [Phycisphaerales bacterium]
MSMHRQQARKKVRVAQALALVFAAGAVAAVLVPRPDALSAIPTGEPGVTVPPPSSSVRSAELRSEDITSALAVMNTNVLIQEREKPPVVQVQDTAPATETHEAEPEPQITGGWRFVGSIISTRSSAAIINDENNRQHVIFTGDKLNGTTLVAVAHDHVLLRDGDENSASRQLQLESRPETLLPDAPSNMASAMGQNELPQEFRSPPPEYSTWSPAQQNEWNERRAQLMKQQQETNQRNEMMQRNAGNMAKPTIPNNGRPVQRPGAQQPGKSPSYPKDK